jgi:D-aminoacyl-tRNA deacylase
LKDEIAVICSRADPASLNIFESLLKLQDWKPGQGYLSSGRWRLLIHEGKQSTLSGVDELLEEQALEPEFIVFASRHEAKSALPWVGGHFTGTMEGEQFSFSAAAPFALRSFLQNLRQISLPGYAISAEATHHGPTDVGTPCFFAEIGSTDREWQNPAAGRAVAKAILTLEEKECPVFLGLGGGHYVARETDLIFQSSVAFGHLFSNYQTEKLNLEKLEEARQKSGASYAYLDRKSLRSQERKRLEGLLAQMDLPVLRSKEIRDQFPPE